MTDGINERPRKRRGPMMWLESRTWRFWTAVAIVAPALYIASLGPWHYVVGRWGPDSQMVRETEWMFSPAFYAWLHSPQWLADPYQQYLEWWWQWGLADSRPDARVPPLLRDDRGRGSPPRTYSWTNGIPDLQSGPRKSGLLSSSRGVDVCRSLNSPRVENGFSVSSGYRAHERTSGGAPNDPPALY